jgi:hypothetical protein
VWSIDRIALTSKYRRNEGNKPVAVPLCTPKIPHWLLWDVTPASTVTGPRLTTTTMARGQVMFQFIVLREVYKTFERTPTCGSRIKCMPLTTIYTKFKFVLQLKVWKYNRNVQVIWGEGGGVATGVQTDNYTRYCHVITSSVHAVVAKRCCRQVTVDCAQN